MLSIYVKYFLEPRRICFLINKITDIILLESVIFINISFSTGIASKEQ